MARATRRGPRGNALVEFVLVLPLLFLILAAILDWGWYFFVREVVTNASRQGARVGSAAVSEAVARADAVTAARTYLGRALGSGYAIDPDVAAAACSAGGYRCITVSFTDYPVVAGRADTTLSGFGTLTRAPTSLTVQSQMRLER